ncbi:HpcH/HpaI aldolase/citrate lyase family protein [Actinoallomurus acaciae]|uniref:HpcH/HpaI aldolase/citrate lyase family protein n=1 Tax=Actinoallomurus acaciae TaxID=502577 RepID=A0ABV5YAC1_9ACTN
MTGTPAPAAITWLFVPGDRPDRFDKARGSGADEVICDLEDAVAAHAKDRARGDVVGWLAASGSAWVRINAPGTPWHAGDVAALAGLPGLRGVVVPKAETAAALHAIGHGVHADVIALIETAVGVHRAHEIAGAEVVRRLAFGSIDYALDIDADESDESLMLARATLVLASRVARKPPPIDGVTMNLTDAAVTEAAARRARRTGFGGKLCVHPAQLVPAAMAFQPTREELRWAKDVLRRAAESGTGASAADGDMIDRPLLERARRIAGHAAGRGTVV